MMEAPPAPLLVQIAPMSEVDWTREKAEAAALQAIARQLGSTQIRWIILRPSRFSFGWIAYGELKGPPQRAALDRFVVVVPGTIALTRREDRALVDRYWQTHDCPGSPGT
jgi:uncharacterized protein YbjT (DUF2867 family)